MIGVPDAHPVLEPCFPSETLVGETREKAVGWTDHHQWGQVRLFVVKKQYFLDIIKLVICTCQIPGAKINKILFLPSSQRLLLRLLKELLHSTPSIKNYAQLESFTLHAGDELACYGFLDYGKWHRLLRWKQRHLFLTAQETTYAASLCQFPLLPSPTGPLRFLHGQWAAEEERKAWS